MVLLDAVSPACRRRLVGHYGQSAIAWIESAPRLLEEAASRWGLSIGGYHDAGHASIVATAANGQGRPLFLKAWTDSVRFRHETAALRLWHAGPAAELVAVADDLAVAALELVDGHPGGGSRPADEVAVVAQALHALHGIGASQRIEGLPKVADYVRDVMIPRVWARLRNMDLARWEATARDGLQAFGELRFVESKVTVLHGDLYRENVLFSLAKGPVFVDPLPMRGPAAFDWAFWIVYYDAGVGIDERMAVAMDVSEVPAVDIRRWCSALFLDGLLYYLETADPRASFFGAEAEAFALQEGSNA